LQEQEFDWLISKERIKNEMLAVKKFYSLNKKIRNKILKSENIETFDAKQRQKQLLNINKKKYGELKIKYRKKSFKFRNFDELCSPNRLEEICIKLKPFENPYKIYKLKEVFKPGELFKPISIQNFLVNPKEKIQL
jgi:hypothetical protein